MFSTSGAISIAALCRRAWKCSQWQSPSSYTYSILLTCVLCWFQAKHQRANQMHRMHCARMDFGRARPPRPTESGKFLITCASTRRAPARVAKRWLGWLDVIVCAHVLATLFHARRVVLPLTCAFHAFRQCTWTDKPRLCRWYNLGNYNYDRKLQLQVTCAPNGYYICWVFRLVVGMFDWFSPTGDISHDVHAMVQYACCLHTRQQHTQPPCACV